MGAPARMIALALVLAGLAPPAPAAADDRQEAGELYIEGKRAYEQGRIEDALGQFQAAYTLFPHPGFLLRIGYCQHELGRHADAITTLEAYLEERPDGADRPEIEARLESARAALAEAAAAAEGDTFFEDESDDPLAGVPAGQPGDSAATGGGELPLATLSGPAVPETTDAETLALEAGPTDEPAGQDPLILAPIPRTGQGEPGLASAPSGSLDVQPGPTAEAGEGPELLRTWWFWAAVGGIVLAAGGGAAWARTPVTVTTLPEGTLGTFDRR